MSSDRESTRIVRSWLEEGVNVLPDRVLDDVLDRLPTTPQRRHSWQAWRNLLVTNAPKFALAGAAVLVVAVLGIGLYVGQSGGGPGAPGPTPSSAPISSPAASQAAEASQPPSPAPSVPSADTLAPGRYAIRPEPFSAENPQIMVTVPAGYEAIGQGGNPWAIVKVGDEPTEFSGLGVWVADAVYEDPCRWAATDIDNQSLGADDFVAALAAQPDRNASEPVDVTFNDGYPAKRIQLSVPDDIAFEGNTFTECDEGEYRSWPGRSHQAPSQIDDIWVIEFGGYVSIGGPIPSVFTGTRLIVATTYFPTTSAEDRAELDAMFQSIDLQVP